MALLILLIVACTTEDKPFPAIAGGSGGESGGWMLYIGYGAKVLIAIAGGNEPKCSTLKSCQYFI